MNYLEINLLNENDYCSKLYKKIIKDFNYDLVIFVAKGGYSLGKNMALLNDCDFLEVIAERKGNKLKQKIKPLFKLLPKKLTFFIREKELKSGMHSKHSERKIQFNEKAYSRYKDKINNHKYSNLIDEIIRLNHFISEDHSLGTGFQIGHSYFCNNRLIDDEWLNSVVDYEIVPLLKEYWFDEEKNVREWTIRLKNAIR